MADRCSPSQHALFRRPAVRRALALRAKWRRRGVVLDPLAFTKMPANQGHLLNRFPDVVITYVGPVVPMAPKNFSSWSTRRQKAEAAKSAARGTAWFDQLRDECVSLLNDKDADLIREALTVLAKVDRYEECFRESKNPQFVVEAVHLLRTYGRPLPRWTIEPWTDFCDKYVTSPPADSKRVARLLGFPARRGPTAVKTAQTIRRDVIVVDALQYLFAEERFNELTSRLRGRSTDALCDEVAGRLGLSVRQVMQVYLKYSGPPWLEPTLPPFCRRRRAFRIGPAARGAYLVLRTIRSETAQ
jgi:hypothetical protein